MHVPRNGKTLPITLVQTAMSFTCSLSVPACHKLPVNDLMEKEPGHENVPLLSSHDCSLGSTNLSLQHVNKSAQMIQAMGTVAGFSQGRSRPAF